MTKEMSNKITNINFILTILIVLLHSTCFPYVSSDVKYYDIMSILQNVINCITAVAVPTFFAISSYLFFRNFTYKNYKDKIKKRIHTLVIPYFVWSIIFLIYFIIITRFSWIAERNNALGPVDLSFIGIVKAIIFSTYNGAFWYIKDLFELCLISPIIYFLCKKIHKANFIMIVGLIILNVFLGFMQFQMIYWLPVFYAIAYLTINYKDKFVKKFLELINKNRKIIYIIYLIFMIYLSYNYDNRLLLYIYRIICPMIIYLVVNNCNILGKKTIGLSKYSFICFCIHNNIIVAIKIGLMILLGNNAILAIFTQFIACACALLIIYVIANVMTKYFPKISNVVFGSRT